ncbi:MULTISPECIES: site-specific integrase [Vibrio harveyi group]|uniref:site-specific integrase n=1 Tax=Vibrio owensii TaxID=696485 RepID=UPI0003A74387|nr:site-specific integrase [Vibrio owensii]
MSNKLSPLALAMFKEKYQPVALAHQKEHKQLTIEELLDLYGNVQRQKGKSEKAIRESQFCIELFQEITRAKYADEVDYLCALNFCSALNVYPKNKKLIPELANKEGYEAIHLGFELRKETLSPARCLKIVQNVSSFMKFAMKMSQVEQNVFSGLMTKREVVSSKRYPFDDTHLYSIYQTKDYVEHSYLHPYYYWIPLLLRYSGARLNELCGLYDSNVIEIDNIPCIVINDALEGQRVKNNNSMRVIPVHSELIRLGFLEFVESKSGGRLFPELRMVDGYYSHNASKWFARRRAKLKLGKGLDCYSFRHRLITELRENDISFPTIMSIAGHLTGTEEKRLGDWYKSPTNQAYSHSLHPSVTRPVIESIDSSHTLHIRPYYER